VGAVTDRLLVDLAADGRVSVSMWLDGELPSPVGEPFELVWPLNADDLEDLRWYLEDYLRAPFGVYGERGPRVAAKLTNWGQAVFAAVFGAGPARDAYVRMRVRAHADLEIVFRSSSPRWLGLPWELLFDPARARPVALDRIALSRSLPADALADVFAVGGERLRVLMVISRPRGVADVGYRMIARPLLERLETVRGSVELVVLRPPTLDGLAEVLAKARAAKEPFQVVHFDGHGVLASRRSAAGSGTQGLSDQGVLVFEKPGGGPDQVPAAEVARVLAAAQVPVVVINACQSGAVGKRLEAALATRLLLVGAASVVAMAYSVYAVAAAEFMAAFYERLFAGDRVSDAVSSGRDRLARRDKRPSPKGEMPLADWVVPVHYLRRDVHFPDLRTRPGATPSLDMELDRLRERPVADFSAALAPVDAFVGRDGLFYTLEAVVGHQRVVVLHGQGGIGKTELAKAFGRWWRDTGGVENPQWAIWHSFEPGLASYSLDGVIAEIGLRVFGADFGRLGPSQRRESVIQFLSEQCLLLIWDNFETVYSMPDSTSATPPLNAAERDELQWFLTYVGARTNSVVLVVSRTEETWLGSLRRIPVSGLTPDEAIEYADQVLAAYPSAVPRRAKRAFAELMEWFNGHPLGMRVVLPYLEDTDPEVLLTALRGTTTLPGLDGVLTASVTYSVDHLSTNTCRLLVAVSMFQGVADVLVLHVFSQLPGVPKRFRGYTKDDWTRVLDEATRVGLLSNIGGAMYGIHPALPAYLVHRWRLDEAGHYDQERTSAETVLLEAYATLGDALLQQVQGGYAAVAFARIDQQRRTLNGLLGYALDHGLWGQALCIAQPLDGYWNARGLTEEARGWVDRARLALEGADGSPPVLDDVTGALWLFFVGCEANRQVTTQQLQAAESTFREINKMLLRQPESQKQRERLAVVYHSLGMIAEKRLHLDEAENQYRQSLTIHEELRDRPGMAYSYHQLGVIAERRGRLDDAKKWCRKSLTILEELGDRPGMAASCNLLGAIVAQQGHLDNAEDWYGKSLTIFKELGDRPGMAASYHQLGIIADKRGHPDVAEDWYRQSLTIKEGLGDRSGMALSYHNLSVIAQRRGHLDVAEEWCRHALTIEEDLGDRPGMASNYHQLGIVAYERGHLDDAEHWHRQSLTIEEDLGDRSGMASSYHQLGRIAQRRGNLDDAEHWYRQSLTIKEDLDDRPGMASSYKELGTIALQRGDLDDAEHWYRQSLTIEEELGNRSAMAHGYCVLGAVAGQNGHLNDAEACYRKSLTILEEAGDRSSTMAFGYYELGRVAQVRGNLDDAEDCYCESLTIQKELGNLPGMARIYVQVGLMAEARGRLEEAMEWIVRCVALFDEFPHQATATGPVHLVRLTAELGVNTLKRCWYRLTNRPLPPAIRDFIE
jgi:tetratricopeptide (TPR) repeat protein